MVGLAKPLGEAEHSPPLTQHAGGHPSIGAADFVPTKESKESAVADDKRTRPNRPPVEGYYYTEHVRISLDEGSDNELLEEAMTQKLRRGWRLVSMIKVPSGDSVRLEWDASEADS